MQKSLVPLFSEFIQNQPLTTLELALYFSMITKTGTVPQSSTIEMIIKLLTKSIKTRFYVKSTYLGSKDLSWTIWLIH
jgi:hypothetical protein